MKSQNLLVAYVRSASQAAACQAAGRNYYDAYWEEIAAELGVAAACYESVAACCGALEKHKVVFLGDVSVSAAEKERLQKFCADGGVVIGALTEGMDDLFGVEGVCVHPEADDEYTIQAYAGWDEAAAGYLPPTLRKNITLPVISRYRECRPAEDVDSLLFFLPPTSFAISGGRNSGVPLLTVRRIGKGRAYYFAFSLTQTLCNLHQGRSADRDWDGDGFYRTGDQITLTQCHDLSVPYGDLYNAEDSSLHTISYVLMQFVQNTVNLFEQTRSQSGELERQVNTNSLKMAITTISILPIACVYPFLQKYFVKGIMIGAVKG